jgi:hypothetical protein
MNSDLHSLRKVWVSSGRCRLHSFSFLLFSRIFACLLVFCLYQYIVSAVEAVPREGLLRVLVESAGVVALFFAIICLLWSRPRVVATSAGLQITRGRKRRIVPWDQVFDIRELPWIRVNPPWYPKMWQVDFVKGRSLDFIGVRQAPAIVRAFWAEYRSK